MLSQVAVSELTTVELLEPLRELIITERENLNNRYINDTVERYTGSRDDALVALVRAMEADAHDSSYDCSVLFEHDAAQEPSEGLLFGLSTTMRGLRAGVLSIPMPVRLARKIAPSITPLPIRGRGANITAWAAASHTQHLGWAYRTGTAKLSQEEWYLPWTLEPKKTIGFIGPILEQAGMVKLESEGLIRAGKPRRYDVGLSRPVIPPRSILYGDVRLNQYLTIPKIP